MYFLFDKPKSSLKTNVIPIGGTRYFHKTRPTFLKINTKNVKTSDSDFDSS